MDRRRDDGRRERLKKNVTGPDASRYAMQVHIQRVFDELIQNRDRNLGNIVWTSDWRMWLIDHTRAFRLGKNLLKPELLGRCDRALFAAIRGLTRESVAQAVGGSLTRPEIDAVVTRADVIVKHFEWTRRTYRGERTLHADAAVATAVTH